MSCYLSDVNECQVVPDACSRSGSTCINSIGAFYCLAVLTTGMSIQLQTRSFLSLADPVVSSRFLCNFSNGQSHISETGTAICSGVMCVKRVPGSGMKAVKVVFDKYF